MVDQGENIYTEYFKVRAYEVDWHNQATLPSIANYLQEVAGQHTVEQKIAIADLIPKGLTWVLMRIKINVNRYPSHQEKVKVITYPTGFEKYYVYRDFKIFDADDQLLVEACSTWLVMDIVKRSMITVPDFITSIAIPTKIDFMPYLKSKLQPLKNITQSREFSVSWHDLDINKHVNNAFYMQWMLEAMPNHYFENYFLKEIDVIYRNESHWKDGIISNLEMRDEELFLHQLIAKDGRTVLAEANTKWIIR